MSVVTNCIFACLETDDPPDYWYLDRINKYLTDCGHSSGFVDVRQAARKNPEFFGDDWIGGCRHLETDLAIAAFNGLYLDGLVEFIRSMEGWEFPETVQLIVKEQGDDGFRVIEIFPDAPRCFPI